MRGLDKGQKVMFDIAMERGKTAAINLKAVTLNLSPETIADFARRVQDIVPA